jgi:1-acyl-sn-glycerol-3-phosphate acyltransferase
MAYILARFLCFLAMRIFFRMRVTGRDNVPASGGFLVASNHLSYLDPLAVGTACRRPIFYMARDSLFKGAFFGSLLKAIHAFPVRREYGDTRAIKQAIKHVRSGNGLLIFPGGTRGSREAQPGIGFLAAKLGVPVVPVFIKGTDAALPKGAKRVRFSGITVSFGKPLRFNSSESDYQRVADGIMRGIESLR